MLTWQFFTYLQVFSRPDFNVSKTHTQECNMRQCNMRHVLQSSWSKIVKVWHWYRHNITKFWKLLSFCTFDDVKCSLVAATSRAKNVHLRDSYLFFSQFHTKSVEVLRIVASVKSIIFRSKLNLSIQDKANLRLLSILFVPDEICFSAFI